MCIRALVAAACVQYMRVDALAQVQGKRPTKAPVTPRPEKNPRPPVGIGSDTRLKGSSGRRARGASNSADSGPRPRRHCQAFERAPARPSQRPGKHPGAPRRAPLGCGRSAPSPEGAGALVVRLVGREPLRKCGCPFSPNRPSPLTHNNLCVQRHV